LSTWSPGTARKFASLHHVSSPHCISRDSSSVENNHTTRTGWRLFTVVEFLPTFRDLDLTEKYLDSRAPKTCNGNLARTIARRCLVLPERGVIADIALRTSLKASKNVLNWKKSNSSSQDRLHPPSIPDPFCRPHSRRLLI
jgi:hypothetical protein